MSPATDTMVPAAPRAHALWSGGWLAVSVAARGYLAFLAALAACALLPTIVGLTGSIVQSGSMLPLIQTGDVVLTLPVGADDPVPMGRVITFEAPAGSMTTGLVLHRLVAANSDGSFVTAGDANADADSASLDRTDIIAQGVVLVPWVGLPAFWVTRGEALPFALWALATFAALLVELGGAWGRTHRHRVASSPSAARRIRRTATALLALAVVVGVAILPLRPAVAAAFTARTVATGSTWSYPAAAPATRIVFRTQPSATATGGVAFARQPVVEFLDAAGKRTTAPRTVDLALVTAAGATLSCQALPVTSAGGLATFAGCAVTKSGTYTLRATSAGLTVVSSNIVISVGPAAGLVFTTSPSSATATQAFATQPAVTIVDAGGNRTTGSNPVTLAITTPGGAALTCAANPRTASSGRATFSGCAISKEGAYTLTATSGSLSPATSASFGVAAFKPALTCQSNTWFATFSWTPTPYTTTIYHLYVNGIAVPATGADGWNSYVQLTSSNVPASAFPQGTATVEVRKVLAGGAEQVIGFGKVVLGAAGYRTYLCG